MGHGRDARQGLGCAMPTLAIHAVLVVTGGGIGV
jgi:hypothetical protein